MKRLRLILILFGIIIVGCVALLFIGPKEPSYHGKTLTEWLYDRGSGTNSARIASISAIRVFGTNAMPFLLKMARSHDGPTKVRVIRFLNHQRIIRIHIRTDEEKLTAAYYGLEVLAKTSLPVPPELAGAPPGTNDSLAEFFSAALQRDYPPTLDAAYLLMLSRGFSNGPPYNGPPFGSRFPEQESYQAAWLIHNLFPEKAAAMGIYNKFPSLRSQPASREMGPQSN